MSQKPKRNRSRADGQQAERLASRPAQAVATPTGRRFLPLAIGVLLLLAVVLVFGQTIRHEFLNYDDNQYVYKNPHVVHGLTAEGIAWALSANHVSNWHPVTWLSHMLDCQIYGVQPGGHYLSNILLHVVCAAGLFWILWRMTGDLWPSALVAALFAVHPLRTESVAWVAERKDILSGLFFVLTLGAYVAYVGRPSSWIRYLSVVALFALGLMAKPVLVTVPFVLLLLDYWPLKRIGRSGPGLRHLVTEKIPLLLLSAASCIVTPLAQGQAVIALDEITITSRLANALVSYVDYAEQLVCPVGLAVFYPHPGATLPWWRVAAALAILVGVSVAAVVGRRRFPYALVGWFWYLGMLVPMIGVVQVGNQARADRYTYLPQIGLCVAVVWGVAQFTASWPYRRRICGVAATLVLLGLMACTWQQASYWRDSLTLWTRALACTAQNNVAHYNLGVALAARGRTDEAIAEYHKSLAINPDYAQPHCDLGVSLADRGHVDEAIAEYQRALQIFPDYVEAHNNLGNALSSRGRVAEAIDHFRRAVAIEPELADTHYNLGMALAGNGRLDEAISEYGKALQLQPRDADAHYELGVALAGRGRTNEAMAEYRRTLQIQPDNLGARNNLAAALLQSGRGAEAVAEFRYALQRQPDDAALRYNLGVALKQAGDTAAAVAQWRELVRLAPTNVVVLNQLALSLATAPEASIRDGAEAVDLAQRAAQLSDGREPAILGTLAAAYAEARQFPKAIETAERAVALATSRGNTVLADKLRSQLKLYKAGSPYRETFNQRQP
jgi:protein O-mannosyl-transferase